MITTLSSRDFNHDIGHAKTAAKKGPVVITDRGTPAHVLLTFKEYQKLTTSQENIVDLLGMPPGVEDIDFEAPHSADLAQPADLC